MTVTEPASADTTLDAADRADDSAAAVSVEDELSWARMATGPNKRKRPARIVLVNFMVQVQEIERRRGCKQKGKRNETETRLFVLKMSGAGVAPSNSRRPL